MDIISNLPTPISLLVPKMSDLYFPHFVAKIYFLLVSSKTCSFIDSIIPFVWECIKFKIYVTWLRVAAPRSAYFFCLIFFLMIFFALWLGPRSTERTPRFEVSFEVCQRVWIETFPFAQLTSAES